MTSAKRIQVEPNIYKYRTTTKAVRYMVRLQSSEAGHTRSGFRSIAHARGYLAALFGPPQHTPDRITLRDYHDTKWWPEWQLHLKRLSRELYAQKFRDYILPQFGDHSLTAITRQDIKQWMLALASSGLATNTVHRAVMPLSALLSHAVDHEVISGNPALRRANIVKLKTRKPSEFDCHTSQEVDTILQVCKARLPKWYPFVFTLYCSGLRFGEAVALERADVNLKNRTFLISKNYSHGQLEKTPKGGHPRALPLFESLVTVLRNHFEALDLDAAYRGKPASPLAFPNPHGTWLNNSNFNVRIWPKIIQGSNVRRLPIKQARHAFATKLLEEGVPLVQVQRLLGHSSIQITADTYGHLSHESTREALRKIEDEMY